MIIGCAGLCCFMGFSPVVVSGGFSSLQCVGSSLRELLVAEHRRWGMEASVAAALRPWSTSSVVVHGLSCSVACGMCPDQGLNPCLLH